MTKILVYVTISLLIAVTSPLALSAGLASILKGTPSEDFKDDDLPQFLEAAKTALDAQGTHQTVEWKNEKTGSGGSILVLGQSKAGSNCKRVRIKSYSSKRVGYPSVWTACKDSSGRWKLAGAG